MIRRDPNSFFILENLNKRVKIHEGYIVHIEKIEFFSKHQTKWYFLISLKDVSLSTLDNKNDKYLLDRLLVRISHYEFNKRNFRLRLFLSCRGELKKNQANDLVLIRVFMDRIFNFSEIGDVVFKKYLNHDIFVHEGEISSFVNYNNDIIITIKDIKFTLLNVNNQKVDSIHNKKLTDNLNLKFNINSYEKLSLKIGNIISFQGEIINDDYWGLLIINISKFKVISSFSSNFKRDFM